MTAKEKSKQKSAAKKKNIVASEETAPVGSLAGELNERKWSVVTFENCAAGNLTYEKAVEELKKLAAEKVAGLCIVTNEAAERISNSGKR